MPRLGRGVTDLLESCWNLIDSAATQAAELSPGLRVLNDVCSTRLFEEGNRFGAVQFQ